MASRHFEIVIFVRIQCVCVLCIYLDKGFHIMTTCDSMVIPLLLMCTCLVLSDVGGKTWENMVKKATTFIAVTLGFSYITKLYY